MPKKTSKKKAENRLENIEERIIEIEKKTKILDQFESAIDELTQQTDKMVTVSINLQAKMTELMIKVTDLTENVAEMVDILKEAGDMDMETHEGAKMDVEPIVAELKNLEKQNAETVKEIKNLLKYMKKMYTKQLIGKAVRSTGGSTEEYVL